MLNQQFTLEDMQYRDIGVEKASPMVDGPTCRGNDASAQTARQLLNLPSSLTDGFAVAVEKTTCDVSQCRFIDASILSSHSTCECLS